MHFYVELIKDELDAMSWRGDEMPNTVRIRRIRVWVVGTVDPAKGSGYLVLALPLLAVVSVFVQRVSIVA